VTDAYNEVHIDVGRDFAPTPGGRYRRQSKWSGEEFRETFLEPPLREGKTVVVDLDSAVGFSTSFLEEAFGGVIRKFGPDIKGRMLIVANARPRRKRQAMEYVDRAIAGYE